MPEYFTLAELRALPDMASTTTYPDAAVELSAAYIVSVFERVVGTSFIGRATTETLDGGDGDRCGLVLGQPYVLSVTSATENGVAVTPVPVVPSGGSVVYKFATGARYPTPWSAGRANVSVTYTAGFSAAPPGDIKEAALQGTRARLVSTRSAAGMNSRRKQLVTEAGTFDLTVATRDAPTGYPEVDAVILGWADQLDCMGFA